MSLLKNSVQIKYFRSWIATNKYIHSFHCFLAIHFFFLVGVSLKFVRRSFTQFDAILLAPVLASLVLTLVFFMGARWRYYAEPFMVIYAAQAMSECWEKAERWITRTGRG